MQPDARPPFSVDLVGVSNLRDLGGYATAEGRLVRRGVVFRSAALAGLTEADHAVVAKLGLREICDFRGREESERAPTRLDGPRLVPLPIEPTVGAGLRDILATKHATGEALQAVLVRAYVAYALESTQQYATLLGLVSEGQVPLLFHCSAGKDRTGFGAALLLSALGVEWDVVEADFTATNRLWRRDTVPSADLPETVRETLLRAEPTFLRAAFAALRERHGTVEAYLDQALGIGPAQLERLKAVMLEDRR